MPILLNIFLALVMVVAAWPSLVYVIGQLMNLARSRSSLHTVRLSGIVGTSTFMLYFLATDIVTYGVLERSPHPADPPVCMAKLIMLRHRVQMSACILFCVILYSKQMQQASTRRSQQWAGPVSKNNIYGISRHRSQPAWVGQATLARRWGNTR